MKKKRLFLLLLLPVFLLQSQKETSKWHFGVNVALDFLSNPVTQQTNSSMFSYEGCASVSDVNGNLLFYSNGVSVWDASHNVMPNGAGLLGDLSASQGALIIKQPGSNTKYYLFTIDDALGNNGLHYSIIDMSLAVGMGSVTVKNAFLLSTHPSEVLCSVKHCNNSDVWILGIEPVSNSFFSFLLTSAGLSAQAVSSSLTLPSANMLIGQLKASPLGNKLASSLIYSNNRTSVKLYNFNSQTGIVSDEIVLYDTLSPSILSTYRYYGCEFSGDGSKLYASRSSGRITQWDLCSDSIELMKQSKIHLNDEGLFATASMQLAPDGKIYVIGNSQMHLGAINNPNLQGQACNYVSTALAINSGTLYSGLPNFPAYDFFKKNPQPFTTTVNCRTAIFSPGNVSCASSSVHSYFWDFGDLQALQNTSTLQSSSHTYNAPGSYTVTLVRQFACYSDTISQSITVNGITPTLALNTDSSFCVNDTRTLSVSGASSYTWSTGQTTSQIIISPTTTGVFNYTVSGSNTSGCSATKTLSFIALNCVGLPERNNLSPLKIFPNPFQTSLRIESPEEVKISFYNQMGLFILMKNAVSGINEIDLQQLQSGLYYLKVEAKNGNSSHHKVLKVE